MPRAFWPSPPWGYVCRMSLQKTGLPEEASPVHGRETPELLEAKPTRAGPWPARQSWSWPPPRSRHLRNWRPNRCRNRRPWRRRAIRNPPPSQRPRPVPSPFRPNFPAASKLMTPSAQFLMSPDSLQCPPGQALEAEMGGLRQAALPGSLARAGLPGPLRAPGRHRQLPAARGRRRPGDFPHQGQPAP
jgi:hypothetical protein